MSGGPSTEWRRLRGGIFEVPVRWAGRGRPLIYLHDAWGALGGWEPGGHLSRLAEHYLVIAPSHPGFDRATGLEHLDDVLDLALYYLDFLDELLIDSPHLIGHGLGGMVAAEMASLAPRRIAKLILAAPYGLVLPNAPIADVVAMAPDELARALWSDPTLALPGAEDPAAQAERRQNLAAAAKFLSPISERGLRKRLHRLVAPTLLVWGEHDAVVPPAYGEAFCRRLAVSRLAIIPNAAHLPQLEQPETYTRAVLEFLEG